MNKLTLWGSHVEADICNLAVAWGPELKLNYLGWGDDVALHRVRHHFGKGKSLILEVGRYIRDSGWTIEIDWVFWSIVEIDFAFVFSDTNNNIVALLENGGCIVQGELTCPRCGGLELVTSVLRSSAHHLDIHRGVDLIDEAALLSGETTGHSLIVVGLAWDESRISLLLGEDNLLAACHSLKDWGCL